MILKTLVENTAVDAQYKTKHGLCFYIETDYHKILFDLGQNGLFLENAKKMGVSIEQIDLVIISHGHMDHAGALALFLQHNQTAKVYIRENAFDKHYTKMLGLPIDVGLDASLKHHPQIVLTSNKTIIDSQLQLFSGVDTKELYSQSNHSLFAKTSKSNGLDDFSHEQNLIIQEGQNHILVAGCSHTGIINIKAKAEAIIQNSLTHVIAGFHLYNPVTRKKENVSLMQALGKRLNETNTNYYTCHCTGQKAFVLLKDVLHDKLSYLATGSILKIQD